MGLEPATIGLLCWCSLCPGSSPTLVNCTSSEVCGNTMYKSIFNKCFEKKWWFTIYVSISMFLAFLDRTVELSTTCYFQNQYYSKSDLHMVLPQNLFYSLYAKFQILQILFSSIINYFKIDPVTSHQSLVVYYWI